MISCWKAYSKLTMFNPKNVRAWTIWMIQSSFASVMIRLLHVFLILSLTHQVTGHCGVSCSPYSHWTWKKQKLNLNTEKLQGYTHFILKGYIYLSAATLCTLFFIYDHIQCVLLLCAWLSEFWHMLSTLLIKESNFSLKVKWRSIFWAAILKSTLCCKTGNRKQGDGQVIQTGRMGPFFFFKFTVSSG